MFDPDCLRKASGQLMLPKNVSTAQVLIGVWKPEDNSLKVICIHIM